MKDGKDMKMDMKLVQGYLGNNCCKLDSRFFEGDLKPRER